MYIIRQACPCGHVVYLANVFVKDVAAFTLLWNSQETILNKSHFLRPVLQAWPLSVSSSLV